MESDQDRGRVRGNQKQEHRRQIHLQVQRSVLRRPCRHRVRLISNLGHRQTRSSENAKGFQTTSGSQTRLLQNGCLLHNSNGEEAPDEKRDCCFHRGQTRVQRR
ncbi:hypothetical protein LINPERPRIM_LOCUS14215 [Linum perenne]